MWRIGAVRYEPVRCGDFANVAYYFARGVKLLLNWKCGLNLDKLHKEITVSGMNSVIHSISASLHSGLNSENKKR